MRISLPLLFVLSGVSACEAWPRHAHLPDDGDPLPASTDPRSLVTATWSAVAPVDAEEPPGDERGRIKLGEGVTTTGVLAGTGWSTSETPALLTDDQQCGTQGTRTPKPRAGDWVGDVDVLSVRVAEDGVICVEARTDAREVGFDLIAWRLDACGIPDRLLEDEEGEPLGWHLDGPDVLWRGSVVQGDRLALVFAGYAPNDRARSISYALSAVLVASGPCPVAPTEPP